MTVACVIFALLLLLPHVYESHPVVSPELQKYAILVSKRRFLSPRDLHGTYSRFLEVSENSTLCPNTVTHNTNGKLYPSGHVHIPLQDISQDGHMCTGAGELVIRFKRRMKSQEIEHEFNISSNASGIDKMVRDTLLALDGFYFGRQNEERKCQNSYLPSNMAFFFTSQAKPFAAKVGVPFRRNPKIMFLVDKTRVCAFSGLFTPDEQIAVDKRPKPKKSMTPKPSTTPSPMQKVEPHSNMMQNGIPQQKEKNPTQTLTSPPHHQLKGHRKAHSHMMKSLPKKKGQSHSHNMQSEAPREMTKNSTQTSRALPHKPRRLKNSQPSTLESPTEAHQTPAPSVYYKDTTAPSHGKRTKQHSNEIMKTMAPLLTAGTESINQSKAHSSTAHHGSKKLGRNDQNMFSSSPSPSELPQRSSEGSHHKHEYKSDQPSNRPTPYPTMISSQAVTISSNPSRSPAAKSYEIILASASPRLLNQSSPSTTRPHPLKNVFTADNTSPSPSPLRINSNEGNQPYPPTPEELHGPGSMNNAMNLPELSPIEVIVGDSSSTCFPSSATVMLSNGRIKRMDELSIGTSVYVGYGKSSRIIDFSHSDPTIVSPFLHFQTDSGRNLTVTASHFIYTENRIIPAATVIVGDRLKLSDGRPTRVVNISKLRSRGLFNPHSSCGHIVVDGFIVSTYTLAAAPMTAHALLAPIRLLFNVGFRTSVVSKLANQPAIVRAFTSLLSSNIHSTTL